MLPQLLAYTELKNSKVGTYLLKKNPDTWDRLLVSTFASKCLAG